MKTWRCSRREVKEGCESAEMSTGSNGNDDAEALRQLSTVATLSSKELSYWKERTRMRWRRWDGNDQIAIVTWWRQGGDVVEQRRDGCDSAEVGVTMAIIFPLKMTNNKRIRL
jgi:hypothetical protein